MKPSEKAIEVLRELRARGLSLDEALTEMRDSKFGLIGVVKAIHVVEGQSYTEAVGWLERRGDASRF
ncbi:hypothetical protein A176_004865 [Myxococcus hansupus]|uniref:Uncharacterized protein n=1 Tax=Pseudomyxococcus hansupus TaxID=1297742 RepID=A0A0H4X276_9BACT|nr:hypothetical protein [Myxococcus hansupus]AKQ67953.1 hypothetical protein A176_004865 [Myxococcus hansupus]